MRGARGAPAATAPEGFSLRCAVDAGAEERRAAAAIPGPTAEDGGRRARLGPLEGGLGPFTFFPLPRPVGDPVSKWGADGCAALCQLQTVLVLPGTGIELKADTR